MTEPKRSKLTDPPEHCIPGMGLGSGKPAPKPHTDPLFFASPAKLESVIADSMLQKLKRETAANLAAGNLRLVGQVLGLTPAELADVAALVAGHFAREAGAAGDVDGNAPPG